MRRAMLPWFLLLVAVPVAGEPLFLDGFEVPPCTDTHIGPRPADPTRRLTFAFPNADARTPGMPAESACLRFAGLGGPVAFTANRDTLLARNGGDFGAGPVTLVDGDTLRLRATVPVIADAALLVEVRVDGAPIGSWTVRSRNAAQPPQRYSVGPERLYTELADVAPLLVAGDVVEVDAGSVLAPVRFTRAGLPEAPIVIRAVGDGPRPVVVGGDVGVEFRGAHHYRMQDIDVRGASQVCLRHEANDVRIVDARIHDCTRHGVLGADLGTGSLSLERVEITRAGGQPPGENLKHPVYVATDRDRYPEAVFVVRDSWLHDYGGNGIKSRARRAVIRGNWIESAPGALYTIELNGYEAYEARPGLQADVVGNVLVHRGAAALRFGGDGTGSLRGRVRFAHNTVVLGSAFTIYTPVLRFFGEIEAVWVANNAFVKVGAADPRLRLVRDDAVWVHGEPRIGGSGNWLPVGSDGIAPGYLPSTLADTRFGSDPGFEAGESLDTLDLAPRPDSPLRATPASDTVGGSAFAVASPTLAPETRAPRRRPDADRPLEPDPAPGPGFAAIGARDAP